MKNHLGSIGFVLLGMCLGSVAFAQQASPAPDAGMSAVTQGLAAKLDALHAKTPDQAYVAGMAAISPAIIGLCKRELAYGKRPAARAEAAKLLTVQQEYDAQIQQLNRTFNIDHSP